jgi:hypothetical protein
MISPFELIGDMKKAQRKLLRNANLKFNMTKVNAQELIGHYAVSFEDIYLLKSYNE